MTPQELASTMKYCKPSKMAKPKGYTHRLEMWEGAVMYLSERMDEIYKGWDSEAFLTACGFYE